MKKYALYDTVTKRFATCLEYPHFDRKYDWTDSVFDARLHDTVRTMRTQLKKLMRRLELNVKKFMAGDWDSGSQHDDGMKRWGVECEKRQASGLVNFGMIVVEVSDENCTVTPVKL